MRIPLASQGRLFVVCPRSYPCDNLFSLRGQALLLSSPGPQLEAVRRIETYDNTKSIQGTSVVTRRSLSMLWINEHKNVWRVAVLVLLLVAIMGPWGFGDLINVPSEFPCSTPYIRLEGDFCARPLRGITAFSYMAGAFIFPLVLPFFSTLLLILRGDHPARQLANIVALGLAAGIGLLIGPRLFWMSWGIWLYVGTAACALILEVLALTAGNRARQARCWG